jgi:hypothetical protein
MQHKDPSPDEIPAIWCRLKLKPVFRRSVEQIVGDTFAYTTFALIRLLITRAAPRLSPG